jgi:diguanylate cyclase (GGDEF)-like protein
MAAPVAAALQKKILVLHNYNPDYPAVAQEDAGLREVLLHDTRYRILMSFEYLNVPYFEGVAGYLRESAGYLRMKYSIWKPDLVILTDQALLPFYHQYLQQDLEKVPVILSSRYDKAKVETVDNLWIVPWAMSDAAYDANFRLMLELYPKTRKFYIVLGTSAIEQRIRERLVRLAQAYRPRVAFEFISSQSREDMERQVAGLRGNTAILFVRFGRDIQGQSHVPARMLDQICRIASVPVFTVAAHLLGSGAVGGFVNDRGEFGRMTAHLALALLGGKGLSPNEALPATRLEGYAFDWRALQRWHIAEDRLPRGSRIEFREYGIWERYRGFILTGLVLMIGESFLIMGLVVNRLRRKKAEDAIVRLNASLERKVQERTRDLWEANEKLYETAQQLAETNEQLDRMSRTDSLTGLYNRRHMEERLAHEHERAQRTGSPFSILLADIDFFKNVNDTYGHETGDAMLRHVAACLTSVVRKMDTVARWGGEEFLLLLPATDRNQAVGLAQRLREVVASSLYRFGDAGLGVTITIGLCAIAEGETLEALLRRADAALYAGKEAGRDRVMVA